MHHSVAHLTGGKVGRIASVLLSRDSFFHVAFARERHPCYCWNQHGNKEQVMTEQELMILICGSIVAAVGLFASYMDSRQKELERREGGECCECCGRPKHQEDLGGQFTH
jgi:hypothetical protein